MFFKRTTALPIIIGLLLAACLVLGAVVQVSGPRIRTIKPIDGDRITSQTRSILIETNTTLKKDQPLDITFEPALPHQATVQGSTVAVTFSEAPRAGTEYTLTLKGLADARGTASSQLQARFTTPRLQYAYVERSTDRLSGDTLQLLTIGNSDSRKLYTAPQLLLLDTTGRYIAVTERRDDLDKLVIVDRQSLRAATADTIPSGQIIMLRGAKTSNKLLLTLREANGETAYVYDIDSGAVTALKEQDGSAIPIVDARFLADGQTIWYQRSDGTMYIRRSATNPDTLPLGSVTQLQDSSFSGTKLLFLDGPTAVTIDAATGSRTPLPETDSLIQMVFFDRKADSFIRLESAFDAFFSLKSGIITSSSNTAIASVKMSDQLFDKLQFSTDRSVLSVERFSAKTTFDNRPVIPKPVDLMTYLLDRDGKQLHQLRGYGVFLP